jgi:hypothetical protein
MASLGGEALAIFLSIVGMRQSGVGAFLNEKYLLWDMFLFFTIRPRAATFTGLLGFFKSRSQTGLADLERDGLLSFVADTYVSIHYFVTCGLQIPIRLHQIMASRSLPLGHS